MKICNDFFLKDVLYYNIGGKAKFVLKIENRDDLLEALDFVANEKPNRVLPLGLGSNVLVNDDYFDGAVLWFSKGDSSTLRLIDDDRVESFASEDLDILINYSFDNNLTGLEWAGGLPSTVGGAIRGNVGAFGSEIKDAIESVEVVDISGLKSGEEPEIVKLEKEKLKFSYRDSIIKQNKNLLAVSAIFQLHKASSEEVEIARKIYQSKINYRNKNHPMDLPSCGSVFKNIANKKDVEKILDKWPDIKNRVEDKWHGKIAMGYINTRLGFSGYDEGGAKVSEKHGNYIVNFDNAKFTDVLAIIEKIKEKFHKTFDFYPELELEVVE